MIAFRRALILLLALSTGSFSSGPAMAQKKTGKPARKEDARTAAKTPPAKKVLADYGKYDFTLKTLDGKVIRLSDLAGSVVLVNIWAPWCGPCVIETPGFVKIYDAYKAKGFSVIGVAVQTNETDVRKFLEKYDVRWPVGMNDDVAIDYGTYGLPDNYLFGPDGSLIKHFIGYTREEALRPLVEDAVKALPRR